MIRAADTRQGRALDAARRWVLHQVDRSAPVAVAELRGAWPLTRYQIRRVVGHLAAEGLVILQRSHAHAPPRVTLTAAGERALAAAADGDDVVGDDIVGDAAEDDDAAERDP